MLEHDLSTKCLAWVETLVLSGISEIGNHASDLLRPQATCGVDQEQQLDDVVIRIGVLDDDDLLVKALPFYADVTLVVRKTPNICLDAFNVQFYGQVIPQVLGGGSTKDLHRL
jgi:hypothetical protein